jgi:hypothetical protein
VQEQARRGVIAAGLVDAARNAVDQPVRRRQRLAEGEPRPVLSSNTAMSVKVPPMSAASRILAPLPAPELYELPFLGTAFTSHLGSATVLHCRLRDRSVQLASAGSQFLHEGR